MFELYIKLKIIGMILTLVIAGVGVAYGLWQLWKFYH